MNKNIKATLILLAICLVVVSVVFMLAWFPIGFFALVLAFIWVCIRKGLD